MVREESKTRRRILDVAQELIQTRGYSAVSFHDLAERVKIRTASIHYHFPTKRDLGVELVRRYRDSFAAARDSIDRAEPDAARRLDRYVETVRAAFKATGRMCLCGILAAEASALPPEVVREVRRFFEENEAWLARVLAQGRAAGRLQFDEKPAEAARALFAALEGALMSAWTFADEMRLKAAGRWLVRALRREP